MEFPKRALTHISESASWKILQNCLPPEWIIRDVTERDYGVDCYLEIVWKDHQEEVKGSALDNGHSKVAKAYQRFSVSVRKKMTLRKKVEAIRANLS